MEESQITAQAANIPVAGPAPLDPPDLPDAVELPDLESLGFESPGAQPTPDSPVQDLLVYALIPHETRRPDLAMVLGVAAELEAITAFAEGPIQSAFELLSRRLRAAVDLSLRLTRPAQEAQTP